MDNVDDKYEEKSRKRLKNHPNGILETQFKKIIKYWKSDIVRVLYSSTSHSLSNSKHRAMQQCPHRVGRTSFAVIGKVPTTLLYK
ncbi:hypothetical protein L6164_012199 [Bauhinia variegata]|uniref:Uncharacterized protein n=1 Tax=Bauhinia variegata TaxID=167791 RepID=A0ACB9PC63_BAUVA|nr:hypothetical protein L6164_012199 [Bauhinia variegata]